jgi:hypothetical protein
MPSWIAEIQGVTEIKFGATAEDRKHILTFPAGSGGNVGDETAVFPNAPVSITGDATPATVAELKQAVDSIIAALVALGLATDNRA